MVIAGSTHDTAVDAKALYSAKYGWLLKWVIPHKKVRRVGWLTQHGFACISTMRSAYPISRVAC